MFPVIKIRIAIDGPGGTLGAPVLALRETLTKLGFTVTVNDNHPMPESDARAVLEQVQQGKLSFEGTAMIGVAHHVWGG